MAEYPIFGQQKIVSEVLGHSVQWWCLTSCRYVYWKCYLRQNLVPGRTRTAYFFNLCREAENGAVDGRDDAEDDEDDADDEALLSRHGRRSPLLVSFQFLQLRFPLFLADCDSPPAEVVSGASHDLLIGSVMLRAFYSDPRETSNGYLGNRRHKQRPPSSSERSVAILQGGARLGLVRFRRICFYAQVWQLFTQSGILDSLF